MNWQREKLWFIRLLSERMLGCGGCQIGVVRRIKAVKQACEGFELLNLLMVCHFMRRFITMLHFVVGMGVILTGCHLPGVMSHNR